MAMLELRPTCENCGAALPPDGHGRNLPAGVGDCDCSKSSSPGSSGPAVFAVDDDESLTELYAIVLDAAGYWVEVFTDRVEALAAFKARAKRPDLLITDYRGRSMSADVFMRECLAVHPPLRILMASGFHEADAEPLCIRPARFIRKPFTPQELLQGSEPR